MTVKKEKVFRAMEHIDPDLIEEAENYKGAKKTNTLAKFARAKWAAMAACLCIVVIGSVIAVSYFNKTDIGIDEKQQDHLSYEETPTAVPASSAKIIEITVHAEWSPVWCFEQCYDQNELLISFSVDSMKAVDTAAAVITRYDVTVLDSFKGGKKAGDKLIIDQWGGTTDKKAYKHDNGIEDLVPGKEYIAFIEDHEDNREGDYLKYTLSRCRDPRLVCEISGEKLIDTEKSIFAGCETLDDVVLEAETAKQGFYKMPSSERGEYKKNYLYPKCEELVGHMISDFEHEDVDNFLAERFRAQYGNDDFDEDAFILDFIERWEKGEVWYRYEEDPGDEYYRLMETRRENGLED